MNTKILPRLIDKKRFKKLQNTFPVVAILGPRQCGKTTFAKQFNAPHNFDLENPRDVARLANPQLTLENLEGLIVIDEVQRMPELFQLLRYLVDNNPRQQYLILGSASRDFIQQSSESLAGRIAYYHLAGFRPDDVGDLNRLWLSGTFPRSYLSANTEGSFLWLEHYVTTFLERDIPQLGISIPAQTLRRFWTMVSHYHGQLLNYSELSRSFGVSDMTIRKYTEILEGTFTIRLLRPWYANIGKRLVKAPKLYFQDSGIFHYFQQIHSFDALQTNPRLGASFEGFCLDTIIRSIGLTSEHLHFYRTHKGAELDLFWQHEGKNYGVECKYSDAPKITKSMKSVIEDLDLEKLWVVYPGPQEWNLDKKISIKSFKNIRGNWKY